MINKGVRAFKAGLFAASIGLLSTSTPLWAQQNYAQTNLVSDIPGMAKTTDPNLVNPWGIFRGTATPWWVNDNGMGVATLYTGAGAIAPLVVTIPPSKANQGQMGTPTGGIFNGTTGFKLGDGNPALFIFVTEDGTLSAWNRSQNTTAFIEQDTMNASVFKGLAIASINDPVKGLTYYLYVADFRKGKVRIYDSGFNEVSFGQGKGRGDQGEDEDNDEDSFKDERIPPGFAPFNVQNIGGNLYVTYAKQDAAKHDDVPGAGLGFVDVFTPTGRFISRLQHGSWFNAPWGVTQAPSDFGAYSHDILVGQFESGEILVFNPASGQFLDRLRDKNNVPIAIIGLWGINFGSGATTAAGGVTSGPATTLFFAAGINGEKDGLFGTITANDNVLGGDH